jgi:hypothetical protein
LPRTSSLYDAIHGWMTGWMDGWMDESHEKASRKMTTTSFTICNIYQSGTLKSQVMVPITKHAQQFWYFGDWPNG